MAASLPDPQPQGAKPSWDGVLVRFGEIGIKSAPVRARMVRRLRQNLLDQMVRWGVEGDVQARGSRLWMVGPDTDALLKVATHTFGVVSASPVRRVAPTLAAIIAAAPPIALAAPSKRPDGKPWTTFAIRARREGQQPYTSQDVAIQAGSAVHQAATAAGRKPKVDLGEPDLALYVDVRNDSAYLFLDGADGPGGIPTASQGKVVCALRHRDDALAAWLMLRRGCAVAPAGEVDAALANHLRLWGLSKSLGGTVEEAAGHWHAIALCSGERLTDLVAARPPAASSNSSSSPGPTALPVLRPLFGLDPEEADRWMRLSGLASLPMSGA